jgi:cyclophilin family peptidyl-prolyl cis-trans isomerase
MPNRLSLALVVATLLASAAVAPRASAQQVVRFQTTVGDFDMVLNPTDNPVFDAHVENMLHYIETDAYRGSWINRAAEGFVLQMGGFFSHTKRVPIDISSTRPVATIDPVPGEPASQNPGFSNTVGTVAMALSGGSGGTNQDSGTSSFFVNLTDNNFLDADFTVFAAIPDMTTINKIMALSQVDLTEDPDFGAGSGNLAFSDVALDENNFQVFVKRTFVVNDPLAAAKAIAGVQSVMAASQTAAGLGSADFAPLGGGVPEPATATILLIGSAALTGIRRRRR